MKSDLIRIKSGLKKEDFSPLPEMLNKIQGKNDILFTSAIVENRKEFPLLDAYITNFDLENVRTNHMRSRASRLVQQVGQEYYGSKLPRYGYNTQRRGYVELNTKSKIVGHRTLILISAIKKAIGSAVMHPEVKSELENILDSI